MVYDDDEFRFNDASTQEGHLCQTGVRDIVNHLQVIRELKVLKKNRNSNISIIISKLIRIYKSVIEINTYKN